MPEAVRVAPGDLKYPKAWGQPALREAIASFYRRAYGADIAPENVMVFAGGRPALLAVLLFLAPDVVVRIASTEYTPYYDMLERLGRKYLMVESGPQNRFRPPIDAYLRDDRDARGLVMLSNPCNPTGVTRTGGELARLVEASRSPDLGLLIDEAYELFHDPPVSALAFAGDIDATNLFVVGAATKGLQAPGIRIGWAIASRRHVEILGNYSSFGMGGVSQLSQAYAVALLEQERVEQARAAVPAFYGRQRERYGAAFATMGFEIFTGEGGFYHWCRLPSGLTAEGLNQRLFRDGAAILKGTDCDMARRGDDSPLRSFFRFSFGPLDPESFEADVALLRRALSS